MIKVIFFLLDLKCVIEKKNTAVFEPTGGKVFHIATITFCIPKDSMIFKWITFVKTKTYYTNIQHRYSYYYCYLIIGTVIVLFVLCNTLIFSVPLQFNKHTHTHTHLHTHTYTNAHMHYIFNFPRAVTTFRNGAPPFPPDDAGNTNVWNIFRPRTSTVRQLPVDRSTIEG